MTRDWLQRLEEKKDYKELQDLVKHHIDSFHYMVDHGLNLMLSKIKPVEVFNSTSRLRNILSIILNPFILSFGNIKLGYPSKKKRTSINHVFSCRRAKLTYDANFEVQIKIQFNGEDVVQKMHNFGKLPIIYFIVHGLERVITLNTPMSVVGNSFCEQGEGYTNKAVVIRCVREDQTSVKATLYYFNNGSYVLPVGIILKALTEATDFDFEPSLTGCYDKNYNGKGSVAIQLFGERAIVILEELRALSLFTCDQCLEHIGKEFQTLMTGLEGKSYSDVAKAVREDYIFVHLDHYRDKFNLLIFMLQKLYSMVDKKSVPDEPYVVQNQEVLLPGDLMTIYLKEKFQGWLLRLKRHLQNKEDVKKAIAETSPKYIGLALENMLKTGNLRTKSTLDLNQRAGMTVHAERENFMRFLSHLRAVHRGDSYRGLHKRRARQLFPESWGFLCPVHTPPGESCGLLCHMTSYSRITSYYDSKEIEKDFVKVQKTILQVLSHSGMTLSTSKLIPEDLEVGYVPLRENGANPGLYLFTSASRFIRPVRNITIPLEEKNNIELIGQFEQVYMEIRCPDGGNGGRQAGFPATHEEIHPTGILSVVASLTPWSNHNPSLQNTYQCQIAKQTFEFSCQAAINNLADRKLYHLQTPQIPLVRTKTYEKYHIDDHPQGTNAIVAVIAYSGYDMKNAITLNKSSVDRGMFRGCIYQMETIKWLNTYQKSNQFQSEFCRSNRDKSSRGTIDFDGLPFVGQVRSTGTVDSTTHQPTQGRNQAAPVRFGEMERDTLLAHGAAYLLHDRLHTSSDYHIADVCSLCGSILTASCSRYKLTRKARKYTYLRETLANQLPPLRDLQKKVTCVACNTSKGMETIAKPYVFRYLAAELAAMGVKMNLQLKRDL
ncbi:hypothetical protein ACJIZ3_005966 [Penstemon smallii]|uniref:DNA-directed RNA polymerase n=1 Tax=Penstemon smallii TaxID=265156 RepID=A0ABD3S6I6_9LAMI